jgi:hypothetical protein
MKYTTYEPGSGQILAVYSISQSDLVDLNLQQHTWVEGEFSADKYYIVDGQPVAMPQKPDNPYACFDYATKSWQIDQSAMSHGLRTERNNLLTAVDRVNPVWFNSLTTQQQTELAEYRQALLAVPQQSGFPSQVNWPAKPTWI